jgi:citrate lyase subunit beta/citryl-CoA lyase
MQIRPRRSVLYMPASNARAIEKARTLAADGIVFDLEDAVAPDAKIEARAQAVAAVKAGGFGTRELFIRINALDTPWGNDDLAAVAAAAPDGVLLPKVSDPETIDAVGMRLIDLRADVRTRLWAMIETPLGVLNAQAIAARARAPEAWLAGFVIGPNDLVKESQGRTMPGRAPLMPWLMQCIAAARAYGLAILDGVYNDFADADGLRAECEQGRAMGFDGKTLIHPSQIAAANAAFAPSADEVAEARKIIAAFERPENRDKGVVQIDGRMIERMHAESARRILALADAIAANAANHSAS